MDTSSLAPSNPSSSPSRRRPESARPTTLVTRTVVLAVVLLAVCIQFFAPHFPHTVRQFFTQSQHWRVSPPGITLRNPAIFQELEICPKPEQQAEFKGTFNTKPQRSMALADQAKRVAAEFDFEKDAVNKAVKEFIREMGTTEGTIGHSRR
jgi:hexokinase